MDSCHSANQSAPIESDEKKTEFLWTSYRSAGENSFAIAPFGRGFDNSRFTGPWWNRRTNPDLNEWCGPWQTKTHKPANIAADWLFVNGKIGARVQTVGARC